MSSLICARVRCAEACNRPGQTREHSSAASDAEVPAIDHEILEWRHFAFLCTTPTPYRFEFGGAAPVEITKTGDFTIIREARQRYAKGGYFPANRSGRAGGPLSKSFITTFSRHDHVRMDWSPYHPSEIAGLRPGQVFLHRRQGDERDRGKSNLPASTPPLL
jgi:hypothetical protein